MKYTIDKSNILGESPIWNYNNNTFYWVDIEDCKIKRFDEYYFEFNVHYYGNKLKPTCLSLIDGNKLFTVVEDGFGIYDFRLKNGFNYVYIPEFVNENFKSKLRFNDGKCDRNGNLYIGTMDLEKPRKPIASIYKLGYNKINEIFNNVSVTNGISFSVDNSTMFFSDTPTKKIYMYDTPDNIDIMDSINILNKDDTNLSQSIQYELLGEENSFRNPDGSTIDYLDNYYSCLYGGFGIDVFSTKSMNGEKKFSYNNTIETFKRYNTCCCFGGQNMDKLFVTSAYNNSSDNGSSIILDTNYTGVKENPINLNYSN